MRITVPRLADGTGVDDVLRALGKPKDDSIDARHGPGREAALPTFGTEASIEGEDGITILARFTDEDARPVGVTFETDRLESIEERLHPFDAEPVVRKDVFVGWMAAGSVHAEETRIVVEHAANRQ